jgi:hypothetical protein
VRVWELPTVACLESVNGDKFMHRFETNKRKKSLCWTKFKWIGPLYGAMLKSWVSCLFHITLLMGRGTPTKFNTDFVLKYLIDYSFDEFTFPISHFPFPISHFPYCNGYGLMVMCRTFHVGSYRGFIVLPRLHFYF